MIPGQPALDALLAGGGPGTPEQPGSLYGHEPGGGDTPGNPDGDRPGNNHPDGEDPGSDRPRGEGAAAAPREDDERDPAAVPGNSGPETDGCWPPPGQGPAPGWAHNPPGTDPPGTDAPGTDAPAPWPHLIDGTWVPAPGSDEALPGLDPIDPACTNPVVADRRTRAQKLLDGTIQGIKLAARTGKLPMNGGLKPQLFISTTETDLQHRTRDGRPGGIAFLPYSGPQPLALFATELCDADVTTMILGNGQEILNVGRTQRLFTPAQRKILIARDKGCSFPHCRTHALATEAHHIIPWTEGGPTNVSSGCLLCAYHHHLIHNRDWAVELIHGVPWFTPPYKLDQLLPVVI
jgi:hypothetical protein